MLLEQCLGLKLHFNEDNLTLMIIYSMIGSILDKTKSYLKENGVDVDAEQDEKLETTLTLPVI
jgi:hypothetical protein